MRIHCLHDLHNIMTGQAACENVEILSDKKKRVILEHAQLDDVWSS